jgi:hypothetical protein
VHIAWIAWDPLALAAVPGGIAVYLYLREEAPRWCGFLAAIAVVFLTAAVKPLLALAHHPVRPGMAIVIIMTGFALAVLTFWLVIFKGYHSKPLIKRKGGSQGGAAGAAGAGKKSKASHHKSLVATIGVMVFAFLAVSGWGAITQTMHGGWSQTWAGITK